MKADAPIPRRYDSLQDFVALLESRGRLKRIREPVSLMHEITDQNENVGAAISIFNRNVEHFNNSIQIFPNNVVNSMSLNKKPLKPFQDRVMDIGFDYKPNF